MSAGINGETDRISALELQSNRRVLYFSDGVMEESSSSDSDAEPDVPDRAYNADMERELPLGPRLRYKATKVGHNILAGIDYVGGGLASLLGITNSKYASEIKHQQRAKDLAESEADTEAEGLDNWQAHNNNRNNNHTLVVSAPARRENGVPADMAIPMPPTRQ